MRGRRIEGEDVDGIKIYRFKADDKSWFRTDQKLECGHHYKDLIDDTEKFGREIEYCGICSEGYACDCGCKKLGCRLSSCDQYWYCACCCECP